ncbi:MAG: hypothetical protein WC850_03925 [Candidatus Gracilibacteria bacterium]
MKKFIILVVSLLFVSQVNALNLNLQDNQTFFPGAGIKDLSPITVNIDNDNEITKEKSFSIVLQEDSNIRFSSDLSGITVSGTGASKILTGATILPNMRVIQFKVSDNFLKGDNFIIAGVKIIIYTKAQGGKPVGIDINGDGISDFQTLNTVRVDSTYSYSDQLAPSEVFNFTGSIVDNKVIMSSDMPGDLDFQGVQIDNLGNAGNIVSSFFRQDMNNFSYALQQGVDSIRVRTVDVRANYSTGLLLLVSVLKNKDIVVLTGSTDTGSLDTSTGTTVSTGVIDTSTGTTGEVDISAIEKIFMIDKYLPTFKTLSYNTFMVKFDNIIDKKIYKESVRIARNDIIKLLKDYEDKKVSRLSIRFKLKNLIIKFVEVYK